MDEIWTEVEWLTPQEAAAWLGVEPKQVRTWTKDGSLVAWENPSDGKRLIPKDFLVKRDGYAGPIDTLKGTVTLLRDCGLDDGEIIRWLFSADESLGETPLQALLAGKKKAVRRLAGALAL